MTREEVKTKKWIKKNYRSDNDGNWNNFDNFKRNIKLPSTLKLIQLPSKGDNYCNCFKFAFGLSQDRKFTLLGTNALVPDLISGNILLSVKEPEIGDYIIYKKDSKITHAGIVNGKNIVVSKWKLGPVIEHATFAVHPEYGIDINYYKKTDPNRIKQFLNEEKRKKFEELRKSHDEGEVI